MKSVDKEVDSKRIDFLSLLSLIAFSIGALIRLYDFNRWSLFNDELSTIFRAKYSSLSEVILQGVKTDVHPAINEVFTYSWMSVFGDSPFAIRLPYVLLSIIALYFAYLFAKQLLNRETALLSLIVLSTTQLFVIYGQLARPYAIGMCILMIFSYCWINLIKNPSTKWIVLTALFSAIGAMTHYFLALAILLLFLCGFAFPEIRKTHWKKYLIAGLLSLIFFLPHLKLSLHQISRKGLGWLPAPENDFILDFFYYSINESFILIFMIAIAPIIGIISSKKRPEKASFTLPFVFILSFGIGFYYSIKLNPVLQFSALIFSLPFLLIFLFSFFDKTSKWFTIYAILLLVVSSYSLINNANVLGPKHFGNFSGVAEKIKKWKEEKGDQLMVFSNSSSPFYFNYFFESLNYPIEEEMDEFYGYESLLEARELIEKSESNYLALGFANTSIPSEVYELAKIHYPKVIENYRYFNSDFLLLSNEESSKQREFSFYHSLDENKAKHWEMNGVSRNDSIYYSAPSSYWIDKNNEYALTFRAKVSDVFEDWPDWINISAQLKSVDSSDIKLVVSIERNGESIDWRAFESKAYYSSDQWYQMLYVYPLSEKVEATDDILIYFWNPNASQTFVDDLYIVNYKDANFNYYQLK